MFDPEVVNDPTPGLRIIKRKNGRLDLYWVADPAAVKAGYEPRTVRLHGDMGNPVERQGIAARCRVLTTEVKEWRGGRSQPLSSAQGTIAWLCDLYQRDEDSPYRLLRPGSRLTYDRTIKIIRDTVGSRRLDSVGGKDMRRWFKAWGYVDDESGSLTMPRRAYGCIQLLRILVNFGVEAGDKSCVGLATVLRAQRYKQPGSRKQAMTREHVDAFIPAAHAAGRASLALAVALQFSCAHRQKDVIGNGCRIRKAACVGRWD